MGEVSRLGGVPHLAEAVAITNLPGDLMEVRTTAYPRPAVRRPLPAGGVPLVAEAVAIRGLARDIMKFCHLDGGPGPALRRSHPAGGAPNLAEAMAIAGLPRHLTELRALRLASGNQRYFA